MNSQSRQPGLLLCLALLLSPLAQAQAPLTPADLDYYRIQALSSPEVSTRLPLNHIGISGHETANGFRVTAVLDDYPAHRAGILRGDMLLSAGGEVFHPVFSFNDRRHAPDQFKPRPESLSVSLSRNDREQTVSVTPVFENLFDSYRSATVNSIQQFPSGNKTVGYVRLWLLSGSSHDLITYQSLFDQLAHTDGLILDLRSAGGYFSEELLKLVYRAASRPLAITGDSAAWAPLSQTGWPLPAESYRNPVAVMIDGSTTAGAELLAYQLDKLSRVITLGSHTAGRLGHYRPLTANGTVEFHYVPASGIRVDGEEFEGLGHSPERPEAYDLERQGRIDPQFQAAFDLLMGII